MKLYYSFLILLAISFSSYSQTQIGDDIDGEASPDSSGFAIDLSSTGSIVAIGAPNNEANGFQTGNVRVFENQSGNWVQLGSNIDGDNSGDEFGKALAISGDGTAIAIGGNGFDDNSSNKGLVRVLNFQSGSWTQFSGDIVGADFQERFGHAVAISNNGMIVAGTSLFNENNTGQIKVFASVNGGYVQVGSTILGANNGDQFGFSLAMNSAGTILAAGAEQNDDNGQNSGHVRVFEFANNSWTQLGATIVGESSNDFSGSSVALSDDGSILAIGATGNDGNGSNSGHVRVFENQSGTWVQIGDDIDGEIAGDNFGHSVALSADGNILAVGSELNDGSGTASGHVRIFENQSGNWVQIGSDIDGEAGNDRFGQSVSLSANGEIVAGGANLNDGNGSASGHVRVFSLSGLLSVEDNNLDDFSMYPNPAKNHFDIRLGTITDDISVKIYNSLGQEVFASKALSIDVSSLTSGLYLVQIESEIGKATKRLVVK